MQKQHESEIETETEDELVSNEKYLESCKFVFGKVKVVSPEKAKKPKVDGEMIERLVGGFCVLAYYLAPMYIHPFLICPVSIIAGGIIHSETFNVYRKDFEQSINFLFRFCLLTTMYLFFLPRYGVFERHIMENSGYTAKEYPLLFTILYDRNSEITLTAFCILFVWLIC